MSVTAPEAMSFGLVIRDPGHISHTRCPLGLQSLYVYFIPGARRPLTKPPCRLYLYNNIIALVCNTIKAPPHKIKNSMDGQNL